jgi:hypothetical protein
MHKIIKITFKPTHKLPLSRRLAYTLSHYLITIVLIAKKHIYSVVAEVKNGEY